ncbi:MAG: DUF4330 family protein [Clostridia bacterium]|nr:DUF4330 family protein [Clostridia bacterium]
MNTKNNSDTPRFNIADVIIIIAIIAVIAALALRVYNIFGTGDEVHEVKIEFEAAPVSEESIALKEKAKLYSSADDSLVGYLEAFETEDYFQYAYNEEGELVKAAVPGKKTVTGTIVLECTKTENGFYLGGTLLLSEGGTLKLYTSMREMEFTVLKITEIEEEEESENNSSNMFNNADGVQADSHAK